MSAANKSASTDATVTELAICIADVTVRAHTSQPGVVLHAAGPDRRFLADTEGADLDIEIAAGEPDECPGGELLFQGSRAWRLTELDKGLYLEVFDEASMEMATRTLLFDAEEGRGRLTVRVWDDDGAGVTPSPEGISIDPFHYPLLQLVIYWQLAAVGGVGLHAAGLAIGDRGGAFCGVSGAGKSTITGILREAGATVASDDRIGINRRDGRFHLHGTPWYGTPSLANPLAVPLCGVFFLEHGRRNELERLAGAEACGQLLARACPPYFSHDLMDRALATCSEVARSVPCFRLRFLPDHSVVDTVRQAMAQSPGGPARAD